MNTTSQKNINGFPSEMVPMKKKAQKQWNLENSRAFDATHQKLIEMDRFNTNNELAEGRQSVDLYKKWMGSRKRHGKKSISWRNLDYTILPILPKFIKIIKNKIVSINKELKIKAIDPYSVNRERMRKNKIISYMANKEVNEQAARLGVNVQSPFEEGEQVPTNIKEVDIYIDAFPKNRHVVELHDELSLAFSVNNWEQIERDIVSSLVKHGVAGSWPYIDSKNYIKIEPVRVENVITNAIQRNDFSDMTRIGEYIDLTIGQIRQMAKKEIEKGEITEKQLVDLANKASNGVRGYNVWSRDSAQRSGGMFETNYSAPYDNEKVKVLRSQIKSTDSLAYVITKDEFGKYSLEPRDNPFWLEKNGYTDEQYSEYQKSQGFDRKVIRCDLENIYQCWWVVGSDVVFNYGLKSDIQRNLNSLAKAEFDVVLYTTDFDSIVRHCESAVHNAQLNWLQFQHHSAMSIPEGIAIDKRALTEITVGGKSGMVLDALDLIDQYVQTGRLLFKGKDADGKQIDIPFELLKGSSPEKPLHHLQMVFQNIELVRNILGVNEASDGSAIDPERGKGVSELMAQNTNIALGDFHFGFNSLTERTARSIARLIPEARKKKNPGYIEALGEESQAYWEANSDRDFMDFSITIDVGWDEEKHASIRKAADSSLKGKNGHLLPQDLYIIENERNPDKAYMILEGKTKERKKEAQMEAIQLQRENAKVQQESAIMAEQAKQKTIKLEAQLKEAEHQRELARLSHEAQLKAFLIKLEKGLDLSNEERDRFNNLVISSQKNQTTIAVAKIGANAKMSQPKKSA